MALSAAAQSWVSLVLVWVGFGAVIALITQMVLPGKNPKSFFGNLLIGVSGSCVGPATFAYFVKPATFSPLSPVSFALALLAAVVILLFYRLTVYLFTPKKSENPE